MPNTPINIYDLLVNRRAIRKNFSDQIISYTLPSDSTLQYGLKRIPAKTVFYQTEKYNDVIDLASDELINDISDLQPTIVSNNFVDLDLVLSNSEIQQQQQQASVVSITLYSEGNNDRIINPQGGNFKAKLINTVNPDIPPYPSYEHVFKPSNFNQTQAVYYYYEPLSLNTQLYQDNNGGNLTNEVRPSYANNNSFSAIRDFDTSVDTNLRDLLSVSSKDEFQDIANDYSSVPSGYANFPRASDPGNEFGIYSQKPFAGGVLKLDSNGRVIGLSRLMGNYGDTTANVLRLETLI
jgi:hypothetical protein